MLGLAGTALAFGVALRLHNLRSAWFAALAYASMGLMLYTNGRGEFAESLIAPLLLCCLYDLHVRRSGSIPWRAALWPALVLMTYLGKGFLVWCGYALALAALYFDGAVDSSRAGSRRTARWLGLALLPLLPSLAWLLGAQAAVFGSGKPALTDIGPVASIWEGAWKLTAGYGTQVKGFMVGSWLDALYLYGDFRAWPSLALLAVPAAAALCLMLQDALWAAHGRRLGSTRTVWVPLCLILPPLAAVLVKGAVGARFHLLYIPVLLPFAGRALDRWIGLLEEGRAPAFAGWGAAAALYVAWAASRIDRFHAAVSWWNFAFIALAASAAIGAAISWRRLRPQGGFTGSTMAAALSVLLALVPLRWGPLEWGRRLAWEPEPNKAEEPAAVGAFPVPDLELALHFFNRETAAELIRTGASPQDGAAVARAARQQMRSARPLFARALERHPDDRQSVLLAGKALFEYASGEEPLVLESWRSYLRRHPGDREIEAALEAAQRRSPPPPLSAAPAGRTTP